MRIYQGCIEGHPAYSMNIFRPMEDAGDAIWGDIPGSVFWVLIAAKTNPGAAERAETTDSVIWGAEVNIGKL